MFSIPASRLGEFQEGEGPIVPSQLKWRSPPQQPLVLRFAVDAPSSTSHCNPRFEKITALSQDFRFGLLHRLRLYTQLHSFSYKSIGRPRRVVEFGRLPALDHAQRGERRPETFAFLGFSHYCGRTRDGRFVVKRKTQSKRLTTKLKSLWTEARRRYVYSGPRPASVAHSGGARPLCLLRIAEQLSFHARLLSAGETNLVLRPTASKPALDNLGSFAALLARFPLPTPRITHRCVWSPREQPYAGKPHVRFCEGEAEWPSYSTIPPMKNLSSSQTVRSFLSAEGRRQRKQWRGAAARRTVRHRSSFGAFIRPAPQRRPASGRRRSPRSPQRHLRPPRGLPR